MFTINHECGVCANTANFQLSTVGRFVGIAGEKSQRDEQFPGETPDGALIRGFGVSHCPHCGIPSLFHFRVTNENFRRIQENLNTSGLLFNQNNYLTEVESFPKKFEPSVHTSWPDEIKREFTEAQKLFRQGVSPTFILFACRQALDVSTRGLGATKGSLKARIDSLRERGIITSAVADWAHHVRVIANESVHESGGSIEDAEECLEFVKTFLTMTFTVPEEIARKRSLIPAN